MGQSPPALSIVLDPENGIEVFLLGVHNPNDHMVSEQRGKMGQKAIAYYRVSTARQGQSGLGLDAQRSAVSEFVRSKGWKLVAPPFTEVESGKRDDRPELAKALAKCKRQGATLVIAKLDRLARDVYFISGLMKEGVEFVAVDLPEANNLTLHIMASMAEFESECISQRTKAALKAAKRRGVKLGSPCPEKASKLGVKAIKAKAERFSENVVPIIRQIQKSNSGISLRGLAQAMNDRGIATARGGVWGPSAVRNVLRRAG